MGNASTTATTSDDDDDDNERTSHVTVTIKLQIIPNKKDATSCKLNFQIENDFALYMTNKQRREMLILVINNQFPESNDVTN